MAIRRESTEMQINDLENFEMIGLYTWEWADSAAFFTDTTDAGRGLGHINAMNRDGQEQRPRIRELPAVPCTLCSKVFAERKTLYRHMRTKHSSSKSKEYHCFHCDQKFARQDIVARHMQTQHAELEKTKKCDICGKNVRPRSLKQHLKSAACQKTKPDAASMQIIVGTTASSGATFTVVPDYLAAVADPMLLTAWLFVKFRPWGEGHRWLDPHNQPDPLTPISIEVLELRGLVYQNILKSLETGQADHDTTLADAIATLMVFTCMTEGWEAAKTHVQGFVRLVAIQLKLTGGSPEWFSNITSLEAFNTALFRDVSSTVVATCAKILAMFLRMIRQAAVDIIQAPLELADKNVWTRVMHLRGIDWYNRYESRLIPIAGLASSVPREASRTESSSGRARHLSQASLSGTMTYE